APPAGGGGVAGGRAGGAPAPPPGGRGGGVAAPPPPRLGRAARRLPRALTLFRTVRHRPGEAYALLTLGRLYNELGPDRASRALGPLGEAAEIFAELGEHRGAAFASYWLGRTHTALGDADRGRRHLTEALAGFRSLRMPFWADRAERETGGSARVGTPPGRPS
ncbi:hypothetical protein ACWFRN_31075, partial [Streptomyces celluloflavus]